jgi:hypothetical protein
MSSRADPASAGRLLERRGPAVGRGGKPDGRLPRLALAGFSPFGITDIGNIELTLRLTASGIFIVDGVLAFICVLKGKYRTALFGLFLPPVGVVGALRLARPSSTWARHRYRGERLERATRRAADFDKRWTPLQTDWENFIGGKPSQPNPPTPHPAAGDSHR